MLLITMMVQNASPRTTQIVPVDLARQRLEGILRAHAIPTDIAGVVARYLLESSLCGVDSHGIELLPGYLDDLAKNRINGSGRLELCHRESVIEVYDGHNGFGAFLLDSAVNRVLALLRQSAVACVGIVNCGHAGRIGGFAERVAVGGSFAMFFGGSGPPDKWCVAPHGGRQPVISTNPISFAFPCGRLPPFVADFSTSAAAYGRVAAHAASNPTLPEGWILDRYGEPTQDAQAFWDDGMLAPAAGHRGYALGLMAEAITATLVPGGRLPNRDLSWVILALRADGLGEEEQVSTAVENLIDRIKKTPAGPNSAQVRIPGDRARACRRARMVDGIPINAETLMALGLVANPESKGHG